MTAIPMDWPVEGIGEGSTARGAGATQYLLVHAGFTIVVAAVCAMMAARLVPSPAQASVLLTACVAWMLYSWARLLRTVASPYWLFVLVVALFNGGHGILEAFGLNTKGIMGSRFSDETTSGTLMLSALSLMLLHLGALWQRLRRTSDAAPESLVEERGAIRLGLMLVLIATVPMFLQLREDIVDVLNVGYFGLYQREVRTNLGAWQALLAQFMLPGAFLLAAASRRHRQLRRLSFFIVLIFSVSYMFMGYRSAAAAAIAAYAWIWHTRIARLPLYACFAAGVLVVFVVFPMVRLHRSSVGEDRLSWSGFVGTLENYDNPAVASVAEMGGTMAVTAYTMELVPQERGWDYGKSYLYALLTVMPNIFGTPLHPSVARGTAAEWLVSTTSYQTAVRRGGFGYSLIAESYLNFGWLGPLLVMVPLGFGFAAIERFAVRGPAPAALMGVVLFFALIFARAESAGIVRPIVWCGFMPLGVLTLLTKREEAAEAARASTETPHQPVRRTRKRRQRQRGGGESPRGI